MFWQYVKLDNKINFVYFSSKEGYTLAQLVEALHYKREVRVFYSRWGH